MRAPGTADGVNTVSLYTKLGSRYGSFTGYNAIFSEA